MVGKLIKHDIKDSSKAYFPVLSLIVILSVLIILSARFSSEGFFSFIQSMINLLVFALVVATLVLSYRAAIYVLYGSLYKEKAYRLFTLPVKGWEIIISKIVTSLFWTFIVQVITIASLLLIFYSFDLPINEIFMGVKEVLSGLANSLGSGRFILFIFDNFLEIIKISLMLLLSGSVANSSYIRKNRGLATLGIFILLLVLISRITGIFGADMVSVLLSYDLEAVLTQEIVIDIIPMVLVVFYDLILIGILAYTTSWFWDHKLEI